MAKSKQEQKQKPKTIAYIDGANMFYTQQKLGWKIDWVKVKQLLTREFDMVELRYYTGLKAGDEGMAKYLRYLDKIGFKTVTKPLKKIAIDASHPSNKLYGHTYVYKANFDVEMTADILLERATIDCAILFSGDSDFAELVKRLKPLGRSLIVFSSRKSLSWELKLVCDEYRFLEDVENDVKKT